MKILISIALIVALAGCTSLNTKIERMYQIDTIRCSGNGIKSYSEFSGDVVTYVCENGNHGRFVF